MKIINKNEGGVDRIVKIFKDIGFAIEVETNLTLLDFLGITFNVNNGT